MSSDQIVEPTFFKPTPSDDQIIQPTDADGKPIPFDADPAAGYETWLNADLEQTIADRNMVRPDEAKHIVPASTRKADLVAALEADDANSEES